jgi:predicted O-linked N-acetylglucosamine transferase (SPINDLY family)
LLANIEQIKHENLDLKLVNQHLLKIVDIPHFGMAYHGIDDKELFIKLYQMYSNLIPSLNFVAKHITNYQKPSNRKIKIGFLSHYFFDHSIGRSFNKIIEGLAESEQFEVIVFTVKKVNDDYINSLKSKMTYVELPVSHIDSFRTIESYELDVLTYADIGMNSETYCLACTRLAPIQCCLFGHPNTTGIATIDYFISSKIMEPEHAQKYYSEKLLLLNSIPAIITKPTVIPDQLTRKDLNLPEDATIYICPMTLYKVHPDFEQMVGKILQQDPKGIIIFFEDYQFKLAGQIVYKRLMQALPDMSNRILFFPWLKAPRFINLLILADAILDTPHFGAGTTGYMAFAFGLPIVTWPGEFLRGRVMLSCYNIMGINDLIAKDQDHYVTLAVRLANDLEFRNMIKEKILQNNHHLYDQHREPVAEMSQLFVELIENYK